MDLEKEKQIVLIIENAQLELKKIIQQGILHDLEKEELKGMTIDLINKTKLKLREVLFYGITIYTLKRKKRMRKA